MKKTILLTIILIALISSSIFSQSKNNSIDTTTSMIWLTANLCGQLPMGKLAETFKGNFGAGTGFTYKTNANWTWSVNFSYMFGAKFKSDQVSFYKDLFGDIITPNGKVMDGYGMETDVYYEGHYWTVNGGLGKIIPLSKRWRNSGLWIHTNFGFFQHKININVPDPGSNPVPCYEGDYKKGYDRRSSGFAMSQFIGYLFIQKNRLLSFYAGVEIYEMWTKPDRSYVFTLGPTADMTADFSALFGLKIGWVIPLHEKKKVMTLYTD
ncbi:MAG: hypothetical protein LBV02_07920 [Bacteroidales bacterium]|jgi:hypothetical protein|nr:hypothetical protein [Bacteroidales bacterium]